MLYGGILICAQRMGATDVKMQRNLSTKMLGQIRTVGGGQTQMTYNATTFQNLFVLFMFLAGCYTLIYPIIPIRWDQFWLPAGTEDAIPDANGYGYQGQQRAYHSDAKR